MSIFVIDSKDNVGTALKEIEKGMEAELRNAACGSILALDKIPIGHKIALSDISVGEMIIKYGVVIGRSISPIRKGNWVHLHNICSNYDERSSHLDPNTGAPKDMKYE